MMKNGLITNQKKSKIRQFLNQFWIKIESFQIRWAILIFLFDLLQLLRPMT